MTYSPASRTQIARAQKLHRREQRDRHKQILVEGPQALRELLAHAPSLVRDVYVTDAARERHGDIAALIDSSGVHAHLLDADEMRDLSSDGQGLVAVAALPAYSATIGKGVSLAVATLDIQDPGNVGTIIRAADAAGASSVYLGKGSAEAFAPKTVRSGAGSHFHIPVVAGVDTAALVADARAAGMQVLAATGDGEWDLRVLARSAWEAQLMGVPPQGPDLRRPVLWVLGNEARGFRGSDLDVDAAVSIPLLGAAESLNVAMAATVCLYTTAMAQS